MSCSGDSDLEELRHNSRLGKFNVAPDRKVNGSLHLDGPNTTLCVWDDSPLSFEFSAEQSITGVLHDRTKISLYECVITDKTSYGYKLGNISDCYSIFPHYVVRGYRHLSDTDRLVSRARFLLGDAATLFHDTWAFGTSRDRESILRFVESQNKGKGRQVTVGDYPWVGYYTGRERIFSSDTDIGTISASHVITEFWPTSGIRLQSKIFVDIKFAEHISFRDMTSRIWQTLKFFELIIGRTQNLVEFTITVGTDEEQEELEVHASIWPRRQRLEGSIGPHVGDVLVDAVRNPEHFADVLAAWMARDDVRGDARGRCFRAWQDPTYYDADRLIGAANVFDLLPGTDFPDMKHLPADLLSAVEKAKGTFRHLAPGPDRDGILGYLGRVGKWSLKEKIHHRSQILLDKIEQRLPEFSVVTDEAVNCRNHYVHGSSTRIDFRAEPNIRDFLTDTLEFVLVASDLVEAGWDILTWSQTSHWTHPFGRYLDSYRDELKVLKSALSASAQK